MNKLVAGVLVAGLLGTGGVAYAASDPPKPSTEAPPKESAPRATDPESSGARRACRRHPKVCEHRRERVGHRLEVAAEAIGIDRDQLVAALRKGSSIAEVAEEHGVDPDTVVDALVKDALARAEERLPEVMRKLVERTPRRGHDSASRSSASELMQ